MRFQSTEDLATRLRQRHLDDLLDTGSRIFGTSEGFLHWMLTDERSLQGRHPADLVGVPGGVDRLKAILADLTPRTH
ncbi:hypothetical protein [Balneatrix alpica]|uniref:hypothetical protein n=1 Tax=Balneatrix alpica TaxID=75684 RepID=UPI0027388AC6|nr:hypothetical protein [Balneatrix alpica]